LISICNGGPSQLDTFDYKPGLQSQFNVELPDLIRAGQRITTMTSGQGQVPVAPSIFGVRPARPAAARWAVANSAHRGRRSWWTTSPLGARPATPTAINHDPACTRSSMYRQRTARARASIGSWISYGLGSENNDLPAFVALTPKFSSKVSAQALFTRMWSSGVSARRPQPAWRCVRGRSRCRFWRIPNGLDAGDAARACSTRLGAVQPPRADAPRRPRAQPHRAI